MNKRIEELVLEAGFIHYGEDTGSYNIPVPAFKGRMEKFAEFIVRECMELGDKALQDGKWPGDVLKEHFGIEE